MELVTAIASAPWKVRYWAAFHPTVAHFRWDHTAWGASWTFLAFSLLSYLLIIPFFKLLLLWRRAPLPLGPLPAVYNFVLFLASLCMFVGCWQAAVVEIEETRWLWRRHKTSLEWILCFPLGTRPAGRVFFWSYAFYLSKYYELLDGFILVLRKSPPTPGHMARRAAVVVVCFLWLEFSQSLQIFALLANTGLYVATYVYSGLAHARLVPVWPDIARHCQIAQFALVAVASLGTLQLHLFKGGGCNGMGAWLFNALLNACLFPLLIFGLRRTPGRPALPNNTTTGKVKDQ